LAWLYAAGAVSTPAEVKFSTGVVRPRSSVAGEEIVTGAIS
jgi:hypothetical protein